MKYGELPALTILQITFDLACIGCERGERKKNN